MNNRHAASFGQGLVAGFGASLAGLALLMVLTGLGVFSKPEQ